MRNEYVSTILHTALHIAGDMSKEFSIRPEYEIGDESSDYSIKVREFYLGGAGRAKTSY